MAAAGGIFPYIGSKISLLSKHGIRYEGVLYTIDPQDSTIALSNVKCFGTEGRRANQGGLPEVEPASEVYEYIIFRGNDIADLTVVESPGGAPTPAADPAIVSTARPPVQAPVQAPVRAPVQTAPGGQFAAPRPQSGQQPAGAAIQQPRPRATNEKLGTGELLVSRKMKKGTGLESDMSSDYAFEEMNAKLDKTHLAESFSDRAVTQPGYKPKSSFFDTISCETLDRQKRSEQPKEERKGYAEWRKLDMETFGETFGRKGGGHRGGGSRSGGGDGRKGGGSDGRKGSGKGGGDRSGGGKGGGGGRRRRGGGGGDRSGNSSGGGSANDGAWKTAGKR